MVQDLNIYCPQDYCPFNNTASKMQTQEITAKDFSQLKKPKTKDSKSIFLYNDIAKPAKKEDK